MSHHQSNKRPAISNGENEGTGKRRGRYVSRACEACRKRKGRCCGANPCEYCVSRNQQCVYTIPANDIRDTDPTHLQDAQAGELRHIEPQMPQPQRQQLQQLYINEQAASFGKLVAALQQHVETLAAQVRQSDVENIVHPYPPSTTSSNTQVHPDIQMRQPPSQSSHSGTFPTSTKAARPQSKFYGPTSPDYSFHIAQSKVLNQVNSPMDDSTIAGLEENQSDDEEDPEAEQLGDNSLPAQGQISSLPWHQRLLIFRTTLSSREVNALLLVFQETIGEYHPIVDIPMIVKTIERWYSTQNFQASCAMSAADEEDLIVTNLVIAIALCVESTLAGSESLQVAKTLYTSCRELINAKLVSPMPTTKHVVIILLVGILHYYKNMPRYAWRMCGLAGRTLMESGLHNPDVSRHVLKSEAEIEENAVIVSTLVVLDRQWSASTGLPTNFTAWIVDHDLRQRLKNPYLKAMVTFTSISDKFNEPITRVARGDGCEDNDNFEFLNFQIEQWRKKSVDKFDFRPLRTMDQGNAALPPAWAILIDLRAQAVRAILLRPFFFPKVPNAVSQRSIQPGIDAVTYIVDNMTYLNRYTDTYQKQHPPFQHILNSGCCLLFLILAYVHGNRPSAEDSLPSNFFDLARRNFENAFFLTSSYSQSSRAAKRLERRLVAMRALLVQMGILRTSEHAANEGQQESQQVAVTVPQSGMQQNGTLPLDIPGSSQATQVVRTARATYGIPAPAFLDLEHDLPFSLTSPASSDSMPRFGSGQMSMSFMDEWPTISPNSLLWNS